MKQFLSLLLPVVMLQAASGSGSGGSGGGGGTGGGGGGVTAPNAAEVRTLSTRVPAGTTFQEVFLLTQPLPIGSGGAFMSMDGFSVNGVAITSPLGDAAGAAVWQNGLLSANVISPNGDYGSNLDYPFMTVTMTTAPTVTVGSV